TDYNDKLPVCEPPGEASWAWDLPSSTGDAMLGSGCQKKMFYCPSTAPKFSDLQDFTETGAGNNLWDFSPTFHVIGYVMALSGSLSRLEVTNQNRTLGAETVTFPGGQTVTVQPSDRVLTADVIISTACGLPGAAHPENNYTSVDGGFKQNGATYP